MNYISANFQLQYLSTYKLFVKTDFLQDTLIVLDEHEQVQVYNAYPSNQPDAEAMKLLGLPFQQVVVNLPLQSLVFIPTEAFEVDDLPEYQEFLVDENPERTYYKALAILDATACYQYDLLLFNRWKNIFPNAQFVADFEVVLSQVQALIPIHGEVMGIHANDTQIDLYVFINGQFQFYNTFEIATVDDLNYFMLNACRSFNLTPKIQKLIVSGITEDSEFLPYFSQFAEKIEWLQPKKQWQSTDETVTALIKQFNVLIDAKLCE